jgi:hypothetical membrane protein
VVASTALLVLAVGVLSAMTPGYESTAETISRLGSAGQPYAAWTRLVFVLYGVLVLAGCVPLGEAGRERRRWVSAGVAGYALAAVVTGLAPKDPPDVPATLTSQTHVAATVVGGVAILVAMVVVAREATRRFDRVFSALVAGCAVIDVVVFRFSWGLSYYGVLQRVSIGLGLLWLTVVAVRLLRSGER